MAPRFNKEPINLINRIPSQKQIDEARPVSTPYGQILLNAGALCWRKTVEFLAYITRYENEMLPRIRKPLALPDRTMEHTIVQQQAPVRSNSLVGEPIQEAENPLAATVTVLPQPTLVQSDEVGELRACMIGQQDEIARLTSHIQELTSLVTSQQEVLLHLGKELETGAFSTVSTGTAAASVKRSRIGRKKQTACEMSKPHQENERPFPHQESDGSALHL